jgi:signal peptidase II
VSAGPGADAEDAFGKPLAKKTTHWLPLVLGALVVLGLDQLGKLYAVRLLVLPDGQLPEVAGQIRSGHLTLAGDWLHLRVVGNGSGPGGWLSGLEAGARQPLLLAISALAVLGVVAFYRRAGARSWLRLGLVAILGGALGNLLDRVRVGYVVDFIEISMGAGRSPTFNLADMAIGLGLALMLGGRMGGRAG